MIRLLLLTSALLTLSQAAWASCSTAPSHGLSERSLGFGRNYSVYVPAGLTPGSSQPLLVGLHGTGGSGAQFAADSGWLDFADANAMIAVFPDGGRYWNYTTGSTKIAFIRDMVDALASEFCIDSGRIYAVGHSNGGYFAQRLACSASDLFAAAAAFASGPPELLFSPCQPQQPTGIALFHGADDFVVSPARGEEARDGWAMRLACAPTPEIDTLADGERWRYAGCNGGVAVHWRLYTGQGHPWPQSSRGADLRQAIWSFLLSQPPR